MVSERILIVEDDPTLRRVLRDNLIFEGYRVEAVDAQGSAARQIQQMQTFINKGAKAIIIEPVGDRNVASGINAAKKAKVPVVVVPSVERSA